MGCGASTPRAISASEDKTLSVCVGTPKHEIPAAKPKPSSGWVGVKRGTTSAARGMIDHLSKASDNFTLGDVDAKVTANDFQSSVGKRYAELKASLARGEKLPFARFFPCSATTGAERALLTLRSMLNDAG